MRRDFWKALKFNNFLCAVPPSNIVCALSGNLNRETFRSCSDSERAAYSFMSQRQPPRDNFNADVPDVTDFTSLGGTFGGLYNITLIASGALLVTIAKVCTYFD